MYSFQFFHLGGYSSRYDFVTLNILLLLLFPQCGTKNCCGYTAYRVNIWGLLDPIILSEKRLGKAIASIQGKEYDTEMHGASILYQMPIQQCPWGRT